MSEIVGNESPEDKRFAYLTDVRHFDSRTAHSMIKNENQTTAASKRIVGDIVEPSTSQSSPRNSRRGGRSFPEQPDSQLDPHWNSQSLVESMSEDSKIALRSLVNQAHEALEQSLINSGISPMQAKARMIARRKK